MKDVGSYGIIENGEVRWSSKVDAGFEASTLLLRTHLAKDWLKSFKIEVWREQLLPPRGERGIAGVVVRSLGRRNQLQRPVPLGRRDHHDEDPSGVQFLQSLQAREVFLKRRINNN